MSRPTKCRRVCALPRTSIFRTDNYSGKADAQVEMTIDEYEAVRLIDYFSYTQEECARQMGVARTTVQAIYDSARYKLAQVLIDGKVLNISGGNYTICPHSGSCSGNAPRNRQEHRLQCSLKQNINGGFTMKIAVTFDNGNVFQHFGHSEHFKIYETDNGVITKSTIVDAEGEGHGALSGFLKSHGIDTLICGGIGEGARTALAEAGIQLYPGVSGNADEQAAALLAGTLQFNPDYTCSHHDGHHGGHHDHIHEHNDNHMSN